MEIFEWLKVKEETWYFVKNTFSEVIEESDFLEFKIDKSAKKSNLETRGIKSSLSKSQISQSSMSFSSSVDGSFNLDQESKSEDEITQQSLKHISLVISVILKNIYQVPYCILSFFEIFWSTLAKSDY